jgi:hypothetical protein
VRDAESRPVFEDLRTVRFDELSQMMAQFHYFGCLYAEWRREGTPEAAALERLQPRTQSSAMRSPRAAARPRYRDAPALEETARSQDRPDQ